MPARRALDDPRVLQSQPFRAVHFIFGLAGLQPVPAGSLVRALEAIGMTEGTARAVLLRYRRAGAIASTRHGRVATYELTPASQSLVATVGERVTAPPPPWDGFFRTALISVPERARAYRERLRRRAAYIGFGTLRPGVLISAYESSWQGLEAILATAPSGTKVLRGQLRLSQDDARSAAMDVWDLEAAKAELTDRIRLMEEALGLERRESATGAAAVVRLWDAIGPFFELVSAHPPLPVELLPADWPYGRGVAVFGELSALLGSAAVAFVLGNEARLVPISELAARR